MKQVSLATVQDAINAGKLKKVPKDLEPGDPWGIAVGDAISKLPKTYEELLEVPEVHHARQLVADELRALYE